MLKGRAVITEVHPAGYEVRAATKKFPLPVQIRLNYYVKSRASRLPAQLTQRNLFTRDYYRCRFCRRYKRELEKKEYLTRDHIVPLTKGGEDVWSNVVTACVKCNNIKADHLMGDMTDVYFEYVADGEKGNEEAKKTAEWISKHIVDADLKNDKVPTIVDLWARANLKL